MPTKDGFTLLEVMIAMSILAAAMGSILALEGTAINAAAKSRELNTVAMLARNQMIELEAKIQGKGLDEVQTEGSGTFESPFEDYRWKSLIKKISFPDFMSSSAGGLPSILDGSSSGEEGSPSSGAGGLPPGFAAYAQKITDQINQSIREISVTVLWTRGSFERKFTVSTYWVDISREISF